ncbi:hypothetical protein [Meiothermus sp. CFH 77666]|uniref:hypothetical protein n=1 Tax=Meiothermus sp. CFH 77666 TaxID=2817942 RepID=UPI001AA0937C|nr:hypothetical protein [Meiothermus sp. CFH 77666]MBO1436782.1 hypothetical protein [Meiothermus sp. CFH 77666]
MVLSGGQGLSLYQTLSRSLEPMLGERTRMVLEEGVRRLGISPDKLDASQAEVILKRLVYRELQTKMSPNAARSRIEEMLKELGIGGGNGTKASADKLSAHAKGVLADLEAGLKRFSLYLDWPEVGRLRGLINVIKKDPEASAVRALLREGQEVLAALEERLQSALLRQTRDIADLEVSLQRVQSVGGPKVKRLEGLIRQIQEAHAQETLASAEVERARALAAEMRKLVESSVVQNPPSEAVITLDTIEDLPAADRPTEPQVVIKDPTIEAPPMAKEAADDFNDEALVLELDFDALTAEQQSRIREIDLAEDTRHLEALKERYAAVLGFPKIASELATLQAELGAGNPLGERLKAFEELLKATHTEALAEARVRYEWLADRLGRLDLAPDKAAPVQARLAVVLETLHAGGLPQELSELERAVESLEAEAKANREIRERQARLEHALATLRTEAEHALSPFRGHPRVESFMMALAGVDISESALQTLRQELSELLSHLAREREEESLKRMGLRATVQALPTLEVLDLDKKNLIQQIEQGTGSLAELERAVGQLVDKAKGLVASKLDALEARIRTLEQTLKESLIELKQPLQATREALAQGRIADPTPLERALGELIAARRAAIAEELSRYEMAARSMKGLGGEELEDKVAQARAYLQTGELPDLTEIHTLLGRLRRAQETLRAELGGRIGALLEAYNTHKSVGGETVLRLKPLCDFLLSASDRLPRLGVSGLLEVRRALEEAERLEAQLAQEHAAAQSLLQELKGADLESLLDVFESPTQLSTPSRPEPAKPAPEATPAPQPPALTPVSSVQAEVLAQFQIRGVEAVALIEAGQVVAGSLPFASGSAQMVFDDLSNLANELTGQSAQLSVISLPQWVLVLVPLRQKGLVILAEKALLSRLLALIERQREALEAL